MARELASQMWSQYRDTLAIRKAEDFAKFTIPSLMVDPLNYQDQSQTLEYDFQSYGSLLVNNATSKLTTALFPPGRPCFVVELDAELKKLAAASGVSESALAAAGTQLANESTARLFRNASLAKLQRVVKLLLVTGNALLYRDAKRAKFLVWSMQSYAMRRDAMGDPKCCVLKQRMQFSDLPPEVQADAEAKRARPKDANAKIDLYTVIEWVQTPDGNRRAKVWQELDGKRVGPESSYPEHLCPWVPVAWNVADGEHMGRGYVEEYAGAFAKLSIVSEQLGLYELESLNMLNVVDEGSGAVVDDYQKAGTGDYVPGKVDGVTSYERGDYNKIAAISNSIEKEVMLLNRAFMYTGQMRDAERVTVEEVRTIAREAENLMGGSYSVLAENFQSPLAYLMMYEVAQDSDFLLGLVQKSYRPKVVTGIPALTQTAEAQSLFKATQEVAAIVPVLKEVSPRFDTEKVVEFIFRANSAPLETLSKDADTLAAEAEQESAAANASLDVAQGAIAATESIPGVM